jgi:hypothetical protein
VREVDDDGREGGERGGGKRSDQPPVRFVPAQENRRRWFFDTLSRASCAVYQEHRIRRRGEGEEEVIQNRTGQEEDEMEEVVEEFIWNLKCAGRFLTRWNQHAVALRLLSLSLPPSFLASLC